MADKEYIELMKSANEKFKDIECSDEEALSKPVRKRNGADMRGKNDNTKRQE